MKYAIESEFSDDQPDIKLARRGAETLNLPELVAVLIVNSGTRDRDLQHVCKDVADVIMTNGRATTIPDLRQVNGIGFTKAAQIVAALELSRRFPTEQQKHAVLHSTDDVLPFLGVYRYDNQENVIVITLSGANEILNVHAITRGTVNQSNIHPREVFAPALDDRAASIILVHNHPSGNLTPSPQDILITERIKQAGELMGIKLLDHIIIGPKEGDSHRSIM